MVMETINWDFNFVKPAEIMSNFQNCLKTDEDHELHLVCDDGDQPHTDMEGGTPGLEG